MIISKKSGTILVGMFASFGLFLLPAQEELKHFKVRSETKVISTEDIVRQFEAPELVSYTLGKGDEITLEIWNHPELSGKHLVGPDGKITLPVAGVVSILDCTREEAQKKIAGAFATLYSDLAVTVRVDHYTSYRIFVLGRVGNPGALQFDSQPTLLDVITRAAVLPIGGIGADKAGLGRCAIIRGRDPDDLGGPKDLTHAGKYGAEHPPRAKRPCLYAGHRRPVSLRSGRGQAIQAPSGSRRR